MLISIAASTAADGVAPRFGPRVGLTVVAPSRVVVHAAISAMAARTPRPPEIFLYMHIADAPVRGDRPGLYVMVVIVHAGRVLRHKRLAGRLDIAFAVGGAALQHCRRTGPVPWQTKACEALGQDRPLQ